MEIVYLNTCNLYLRRNYFKYYHLPQFFFFFHCILFVTVGSGFKNNGANCESNGDISPQNGTPTHIPKG